MGEDWGGIVADNGVPSRMLPAQRGAVSALRKRGLDHEEFTPMKCDIEVLRILPLLVVF
jgi:hypothetical protein